MQSGLRPYFDHVIPVFWPWLWWNLIRVALWHKRTGRDALLRLDRFGNIRFVYIQDAPQPDDLYSYEAPKVTSWDRLAPGFGLPDEPDSLSGMPGCVRAFYASVRAVFGHIPDIPEQVRGPPWPPPALMLRLRSA
jgi:hypothetical protein